MYAFSIVNLYVLCLFMCFSVMDLTHFHSEIVPSFSSWVPFKLAAFYHILTTLKVELTVLSNLTTDIIKT